MKVGPQPSTSKIQKDSTTCRSSQQLSATDEQLETNINETATQQNESEPDIPASQLHKIRNTWDAQNWIKNQTDQENKSCAKDLQSPESSEA